MRLHSEGLTQRVIAERVGVSQSTVGRILRGERCVEPVAGAVSAAFARLLEQLELDPAASVLAEVAATLARKLDGCSASDSAASAQAAPRLADELARVLERIAAAQSGKPSRDVVRLLKEIR